MSQLNLEQLLAGEFTSHYRSANGLEPITRLQISAGLKNIPKEVFLLADCLEVLDLSNNDISDLPDDMASLQNMRILFLSNNQFERIPAILARCPKLEMISFKSNNLVTVDEDVLPLDTRWLILTDNKIQRLPDSMGRLHRLQKLALAGNCLAELPSTMADCQNLELARLSANKFKTMPDWLFNLPKLSWLAFSGNNFSSSFQHTSQQPPSLDSVPYVALEDMQLSELLGEGASGFIHRGDWLKQPDVLAGTENHIAVKIFKGDVTSDGFPQDELNCCLKAGEHPGLIKVIAQLDQTDKDKKLGLVMELIPSSFYNLGLPPSLKTCTRDTFKSDTKLSSSAIAKISLQMAQAMKHMHNNGISHGDVYAHNTMINDQAEALFGDFGAATDLSDLPKSQQLAMERVEVRALGCLLEDLLTHCAFASDLNSDCHLKLVEYANNCLTSDLVNRLNLEQAIEALEVIFSKYQ